MAVKHVKMDIIKVNKILIYRSELRIFKLKIIQYAKNVQQIVFVQIFKKINNVEMIVKFLVQNVDSKAVLNVQKTDFFRSIKINKFVLNVH